MILRNATNPAKKRGRPAARKTAEARAIELLSRPELGEKGWVPRTTITRLLAPYFKAIVWQKAIQPLIDHSDPRVKIQVRSMPGLHDKHVVLYRLVNK